MARDWYTVYTEPNQESVVATALQHQVQLGRLQLFEVVGPLYESRVKTQHVTQKLLFPQQVFINADLDDAATDEAIRSVRGFMKFYGDPTPQPLGYDYERGAPVIEAIKELATTRVPFEEESGPIESPFNPGDSVAILPGHTFTGLTGTVSKILPNGLVELTIDFKGKSLKTRISPEYLRKLS